MPTHLLNHDPLAGPASKNAFRLGHSDLLVLQAEPTPILSGVYHVNPSQEQGLWTTYSKYLDLFSSM